jgi:hypothetical protein
MRRGWQQLAEEQDQVMERGQLLAGGLTRSHLLAQVAGGRWRQLTETVYVLHKGPLTERQQWWAAALAIGPLAGRTALRAAGVRGWPSQQVEVIVARGATPSRPLGLDVKVHESRRLTADDVVVRASPPRLRLERSAVDAAAWTRDARAACGLLASVVQQRLTTATRLQLALDQAGAVRHVKLMRAVLIDIEGGAHAMTEVDFGRLCRRYGLVLVRQVVRRDGAGRKRYVDAEVSAPGGRSVFVEVDGAMHLVPMTYWADMSRGNELVIARAHVLRFPSIALRIEEATVGNQLRRACGLDPLSLPRAA